MLGADRQSYIVFGVLTPTTKNPNPYRRETKRLNTKWDKVEKGEL